MFKPKGVMFLTLAFTLLSLSCSSAESDQPLLTAELPLYLEEHLDDARIKGSEIPKNVPTSVEWNFNEPQPDWRVATPHPFPVGIRPATVSQTEDALHITLGPSTANPSGNLIGGVYVDVLEWDLRDWGHVVVQARSSGPGIFGLGFNVGQGEGQLWPLPYEMLGVQGLSLVDDGTVQTYQLLVEPEYSWKEPEPIRQLGLWFHTDDPLEVEILSVTVVPFDALWISRTERNNSYRRSLFVHTPTKIEYRVQGPVEGCFNTALGNLWPEVPVTFRVTVRAESREAEILLEESHGEREIWLQRHIDLSAYAGQVITLSLEAESAQEGNVALWGAPTLMGPHSYYPGKQTGINVTLNPEDVEKPVRISFLLYVPSDYGVNKSKKYPMILFLHGSGSMGTYIERIKRNGLPAILDDHKDFPFIVVSPQCPPNKPWDVKVLMALVDYAIAKYRVDSRRVSVTGMSMGGAATWGLVSAYPDRFAAAVPICGWGDPRFAPKLTGLSIWIFHGAKDQSVPVSASREMHDAVTKAGGNSKLTVYPNADHDSFTRTYDDPELYNWLLQQKR